MQEKSFYARGNNAEQILCNFLLKFPDEEKTIVKHFNQVMQVCFEDYSFTNSNQIMNVATIDYSLTKMDAIIIHFVVGGIGENMIWNINWGAGDRRISKFEEALKKECTENGVELWSYTT